MKNIKDLFKIKNNQHRIAVVAAEDINIIKAVIKAIENNWATFQLYGQKNEIIKIFEQLKVKINEKITIINCDHVLDAAHLAITAIKDQKADILMKGNITTKDLLRLVLDKKYNLYEAKQLLSHITVANVNNYHKFLFITDCALNINPSFENYITIINNALRLAKTLNVNNPKVALLAAFEKVNEKMPITVVWSKLKFLSEKTWVLPNEIDGPLALDNAINIAASTTKKITSPIAGDADILIVPNIESGNLLYKSLVYFANAKVAGVVVGAKMPIILTSRADSEENRLYSIALAIKIISK